MFAILYETGTSGFYLGFDTTFEESENRFSRITDDLLKNIKSNKKEDFNDFFENQTGHRNRCKDGQGKYADIPCATFFKSEAHAHEEGKQHP